MNIFVVMYQYYHNSANFYMGTFSSQELADAYIKGRGKRQDGYYYILTDEIDSQKY